jgi:hypothetical protein
VWLFLTEAARPPSVDSAIMPSCTKPRSPLTSTQHRGRLDAGTCQQSRCFVPACGVARGTAVVQGDCASTAQETVPARQEEGQVPHVPGWGGSAERDPDDSVVMSPGGRDTALHLSEAPGPLHIARQSPTVKLLDTSSTCPSSVDWHHRDHGGVLCLHSVS